MPAELPAIVHLASSIQFPSPPAIRQLSDSGPNSYVTMTAFHGLQHSAILPGGHVTAEDEDL
jgi:hypothetical protein